MIYDPVTTFAIYLVAILAIFTLIAFVEEQWTKKVERDARHQARAQARVERREERELSSVEWQ